MSDRMHPIPFKKMIKWIFDEYKCNQTIFGVHKSKFYHNTKHNQFKILGENLSTLIGPAAGPNTQLAQNIVASYLTGSRYIELKTVQVLDGEDLPVEKPCIAALDECYNVEWSTELTVNDAFNEYIKAWFLLHVFMKELQFSKNRDFLFNMSVGYDLEGIKSPKINAFIEGLKDATNSTIWKECQQILKDEISKFTHFTLDDLKMISPHVCTSITLSTLHGCPPEEIERITQYLLKEKKLHTYIKMNPTLLGEQFVRETLNKMGYDYITLNSHHFIHDLQYEDGISMLKRLKSVANDLNLEMGVKLSNTLPVKILNKELPGEEMYMSGRSLYPLTISLASQIAKEFSGDINISYSGGADYFNIEDIIGSGIRPVTFATTILKPGGYERINQLARMVESNTNFDNGIDCNRLSKLALDAMTNKHYLKTLRHVGNRKLELELPLFDCAISPCKVGCPIHQQIPEYMSLLEEGNYNEAFSVIAIDNAAPSITGTICNHNCQFKCTRLDYDQSVAIRNMKKIAADFAQTHYLENTKPKPVKSDKKVVIIGAGPAGLSTALFLRRNGLDVTVMEQRDKPYGVIEYAIPEFRISSELIKRDFELVKREGVKFQFGVPKNFNIEDLKHKFKYIVLAIGASVPNQIQLKEGSEQVLQAISFLEDYKLNKETIALGKHVCVIGGGNVALDASRAAIRVPGVEKVSIIYRRTKAYMPAFLEEVELAMSEGIEIKELLTPISFKEGKLYCEEMELISRDESGRRKPVSTGNIVTIDTDTVITAVGEHIDSQLLTQNGIEVDDNCFPIVNTVNETNLSNVYIAGDLKKGPATIVKAIADGKLIAKDILSKEGLNCDFVEVTTSQNESNIYDKKGILCDQLESITESNRCLSCHKICEVCVDVCPNRANVVIEVNGTHQIIHLDALCNECGNCGVFCPYKGNPYQDKFTLFLSESDLHDSKNIGFYVKDLKSGECVVRKSNGDIVNVQLGECNEITKEVSDVIKSCLNNYRYLF